MDNIRIKKSLPVIEGESVHILKLSNHIVPVGRMKELERMVRLLIRNSHFETYEVDIEIRGVKNVTG